MDVGDGLDIWIVSGTACPSLGLRSRYIKALIVKVQLIKEVVVVADLQRCL